MTRAGVTTQSCTGASIAHLQRLFLLPAQARTCSRESTELTGGHGWNVIPRSARYSIGRCRLVPKGASNYFSGVAWQDGETVVDVGGGNGTLVIELLQRQPQLRGVVFDLPEVAAEAEARGEAAGLSDRCRVVPGSFFDEVPTGGDVYVLAKVLHDWDDAAAIRILTSVRAAAPDHARLLVIDSVVPDGNAPHPSKALDLVMLSLVDGRERGEDEWRQLLEVGGFRPPASVTDLCRPHRNSLDRSGGNPYCPSCLNYSAQSGRTRTTSGESNLAQMSFSFLDHSAVVPNAWLRHRIDA